MATTSGLAATHSLWICEEAGRNRKGTRALHSLNQQQCGTSFRFTGDTAAVPRTSASAYLRLLQLDDRVISWALALDDDDDRQDLLTEPRLRPLCTGRISGPIDGPSSRFMAAAPDDRPALQRPSLKLERPQKVGGHHGCHRNCLPRRHLTRASFRTSVPAWRRSRQK